MSFRHADALRALESRRAFLAWLAAVPLVGCAGASGDDEPTAPPPPAGDPVGSYEDEFHEDAGVTCRATTRDAEGPYFEAGSPSRIQIASATEPGVRLVVRGRLLGPDCRRPLAGYALDIWQADASGRYHDAVDTAYRLRGKVVTDALGNYRFETILPGRYGDAAGIRPAHLHAKVLTPAGNPLLTTQLYFAGDPYLGQADYCTRQGTCNSADPARVLRLQNRVGAAGKQARFDAILART